jgi:transposase
MTKTSRSCYPLECKQEAVRLVDNGQSTAAVARTLGVVDQTLSNWVKAHKQGKLTGADSKPVRMWSEITSRAQPLAGTAR